MSEAQAPEREFEQLLEYLRQNRGFDFSGYKRPSLMRRVLKRMQSINVESFSLYVDYLEVHPEEFTALFNTILVNVTSFFRDEDTWKYFEAAVLPQILSAKKGDAPIRIWSAGCASGEEPYSLAMLMAGALGKETLHTQVKIYATDADEEALVTARQAVYSDKDVQPVPPELREKYFDRVNGHYLFNSDLRRAVIFGRHDLVQDAPISHLDLLVCRNTLMYFNAETQSRIMSRFSYAINPGGFLMLGKAEMLLLYSPLYIPVELKHRIFSKTAQNRLGDRSVIIDENTATDPNALNRNILIRAAVFESGQLAQIVVDSDGNLLMANEQARQLYELERNDVGRPFRDLALSYQPAELRSLIDQAYAERRIVTLANVERHLKDGDTRTLDIQLVPLSVDDALVGVCITFQDVTRFHKVQQEVERARMESEAANEELETSNEELQSTNEELETMNEEMQSTNEELQTTNDELRVRTDELNRSNAFLQSVLASLRGGVVVVDTKLTITAWNPGAEELWGLRSAEVKGQSLLSLDIGLPVRRLRNPIQTCIADGAEPQALILDAVNRRGRNIKCRVAINPLTTSQGQREGAIIVTEEMGM